MVGYMSKKKKVTLGILGGIGALIVLALILILLFLPRYLIGEERVTPSVIVDDEITVMSCNVRYYTPLDLFRRSWFYRAELIAEEVAAVSPDIVGFQEVTFIHQSYLERIMQGYANAMAYRDEFVLSEGCPIFYRTDKYELVEEGSFWLSETPEVMSKSWGSAHYRIAVYVLLRDRASGEEIAVFNAHLDHESEQARINGIKVVLDKIAELGDMPAILLGDLNAEPDSETLKSAYESFDDSALIANEADSGATFHAWGENLDRERIDYILVTKGDAVVYEYRIVDNLHGKEYASDHSPIYVKLKISPSSAE